MITRLRLFASLSALSLLLTVGCEKVPLLAPSGSNISLNATTNVLPVNASTDIVAQVLEPAGTPPHSGTHIIFTTTLGTIQPSEAETDINGRAVVKFLSGSASGTATITAASGGANVGANGGLKISVGTAAVGKVILNATPSLVPATGGTSTITAVVYDINGNTLPSAPIAFSTTAGSLDKLVATTNANGEATTTLTTATQATVTGSVGAQGGSSGGQTPAPTTPPSTTPTTPAPTTGQSSGSVTVGIASAPSVLIKPPTTAITAGLPASFTFTVTAATTNGSAVRDLTVSWGDGETQDLGAVTGDAVVSHTYRSPGTYRITATVTDSSGNSVAPSTAVTVTSTVLPITITPPSTPPGAGLPATFTIVIGTLPAGDNVRNVHIDWGDGSAQDLGAISGSTSVSHPYVNAGSYNVTATLTDTVGNTATVTSPITVVPTASPTIIITPSVATATRIATFQIQVTPPSGVGIQDALLDFGDGAQNDLGGLTGSITVTHPYQPPAANFTFTVKLTVTDTLGRKTTGTTTVLIP